MKKREKVILFVDDEIKTLKYFKKIFEEKYKILVAKNGNEALTLAATESDSINVILCDQRMPGLDGVELLTVFALQYPKIVRIISTAYADTNAAVDSINRGAVFRYVTKPWDIDQLAIVLDEALNLNDDITAHYDPRKHELADGRIIKAIGCSGKDSKMISEMLGLFKGVLKKRFGENMPEILIKDNGNEVVMEILARAEQAETITADLSSFEEIISGEPSEVQMESGEVTGSELWRRMNRNDEKEKSDIEDKLRKQQESINKLTGLVKDAFPVDTATNQGSKEKPAQIPQGNLYIDSKIRFIQMNLSLLQSDLNTFYSFPIFKRKAIKHFKSSVRILCNNFDSIFLLSDGKKISEKAREALCELHDFLRESLSSIELSPVYGQSVPIFDRMKKIFHQYNNISVIFSLPVIPQELLESETGEVSSEHAKELQS